MLCLLWLPLLPLLCLLRGGTLQKASEQVQSGQHVSMLGFIQLLPCFGIACGMS
jgi:hypothetical protein